MVGARVGAWLLVGLVLAVPAAMAETGALQGRIALPVQVSGHHEAAGEGAFAMAGAGGTLSLLLQGGEGKVTRIIHRAFGYVSSQDPQAEVLWGQKTERVETPLEGGLLSLSQRRDAFQLLVQDAHPSLADGMGGEGLLVGALTEDRVVHDALQRPLSIQLLPTDDRFSAVLEAGQFLARAQSGRLNVDGPFRLFVSDAVLQLTPSAGNAQTVAAHFRTETRPGTLYNPLTQAWFGAGSHTEYVQESLLVEGRGLLQVQFAGTAGDLVTPLPTLQVDGQAVLPAMTGTVKVQGGDQDVTHRLDGQDLRVDGRFTLRLHGLQGEVAQVEGDGDLTSVRYGAVAAIYPWATVAAVGLGALLLAAGAWVAAHAKTLMGGAAGGLIAGYARVHGEEILEHAGRAEVYERVKASPGIHFVQLAGQVGFGDSTLVYHLRVLERNGFVTSLRDGRYVRFFDRRSGHYAGGRKNAVSALRNPTTAAMARHIRDHPGVAQCDLAAAFGVTASTVTWHMNRLAAAGLVSKGRDGPHTRYRLAEGWTQLPAQEQARQAAPAPAPVAVAPALAAA